MLMRDPNARRGPNKYAKNEQTVNLKIKENMFVLESVKVHEFN